MALIVQKFGGTSVSDTIKIKKVVRIIFNEYKHGHKLVVVVSAMGKTTNSLIRKCSKVSELSSRHHMKEYDVVLSSGETITSGLVALALQGLGIKARSLQAWQIPIMTDSVFANAQVDFIDSEFICDLVAKGIVPVITGFQGLTKKKELTTLGKGGSDTTAALIAAAIGAERLDIYTDVVGVFSADPKVVNNAVKIDHMTCEQMLILTSYGAKVLHPRAALAASRYKLDIRILSTFDKTPGTLITSKTLVTRKMEKRLITAITSNKNLIKIDIALAKNTFSEVILNLSKEGCIVDKIRFFGNKKISLVTSIVEKNRFQSVLDNLKSLSKVLAYSIKSNISTVTGVGYSLKNNEVIWFEIFSLLTKEKIKVYGINLNESMFNIILASKREDKAVKLLHKYFNLSNIY